jgi:hypothetical protein
MVITVSAFAEMEKQNNKKRRSMKEDSLSLSYCTLFPLSMNLMATSSLVSLFRISFATPKLPAPISRTGSYLSIIQSKANTVLNFLACLPYLVW